MGTSGGDGPDPREQLPFPVLVPLGHHRSVEVEQDCVAPARHRFEDRVADVLVGGRVHRAARGRVRGDGRHDLRPRRFRLVDESGRAGPRAPVGGEDFGPRERAFRPLREPGEIGGNRRERVRLVLHHREDHAGHAATSLPCGLNPCRRIGARPSPRRPRTRTPAPEGIQARRRCREGPSAARSPPTPHRRISVRSAGPGNPDDGRPRLSARGREPRMPPRNAAPPPGSHRTFGGPRCGGRKR